MKLLKLLKPKTPQKERVKLIKNFTSKNKIFTFFAIIIVIFLGVNSFSNLQNNSSENNENKIVEDESQLEDTLKDTQIKKIEKWEFSFLDLWILALGGGFCGVQILREKNAHKKRGDL
jgi:hypothetical protein